MASRVVRVVVTVAMALLVLAAPGVAAAAPRSAPSPSTPTTLVIEHGDELNNSLPKPNSGEKPTDAGSPGGSAQLGLLGAMVVGTAFIAFMITREVRKGRRRIEAAARR